MVCGISRYRTWTALRAAEVKEITPALPVLVVTMPTTRAGPPAVQGGAAGYVLKGIGRAELLASVRAVRNGESVLDPGLLRAVVDGNAAARTAAPPLSRVELDLLRLVADGLTNREIGQRLRWSPATVKKYVQRILEKLDGRIARRRRWKGCADASGDVPPLFGRLSAAASMRSSGAVVALGQPTSTRLPSLRRPAPPVLVPHRLRSRGLPAPEFPDARDPEHKESGRAIRGSGPCARAASRRHPPDEQAPYQPTDLRVFCIAVTGLPQG